jgi:hypothetical protein
VDVARGAPQELDTTGAGRQRSEEHLQERGLPRPVRSHQRHELAGPDREGDIPEYGAMAVVERQVERAEERSLVIGEVGLRVRSRLSSHERSHRGASGAVH